MKWAGADLNRRHTDFQAEKGFVNACKKETYINKN
jgi:hypothetical protein